MPLARGQYQHLYSHQFEHRIFTINARAASCRRCPLRTWPCTSASQASRRRLVGRSSNRISRRELRSQRPGCGRDPGQRRGCRFRFGAVGVSSIDECDVDDSVSRTARGCTQGWLATRGVCVCVCAARAPSGTAASAGRARAARGVGAARASRARSRKTDGRGRAGHLRQPQPQAGWSREPPAMRSWAGAAAPADVVGCRRPGRRRLRRRRANAARPRRPRATSPAPTAACEPRGASGPEHACSRARAHLSTCRARAHTRPHATPALQRTLCQRGARARTGATARAREVARALIEPPLWVGGRVGGTRARLGAVDGGNDWRYQLRAPAVYPHTSETLPTHAASGGSCLAPCHPCPQRGRPCRRPCPFRDLLRLPRCRRGRQRHRRRRRRLRRPRGRPRPRPRAARTPHPPRTPQTSSGRCQVRQSCAPARRRACAEYDATRRRDRRRASAAEPAGEQQASAAVSAGTNARAKPKRPPNPHPPPPCSYLALSSLKSSATRGLHRNASDPSSVTVPLACCTSMAPPKSRRLYGETAVASRR